MIEIKCYGVYGVALRGGEVKSFPNPKDAETFLIKQFQVAPDGYVIVNNRFGFTLNQALRQVERNK